jgi:hypothetical protein
MRLSTAALAGALALACWTFPAVAQQARSLAASPARAPVPGAFPGTLDPSTKIFTPLGPGAAAGAFNKFGKLEIIFVLIISNLDRDLTKDDSIILDWILEFGTMIPIHGDVVNGNAVNQILVPNYTARASLNFGAGNPVPEVPIPFAFTPTSPNP